MLFVARCSLCVDCCWLIVASLSVVCFSLVDFLSFFSYWCVACCLFGCCLCFVVFCLLFDVRCSLFDVYCMLFVACGLVFGVCCLMYGVCCFWCSLVVCVSLFG